MNVVLFLLTNEDIQVPEVAGKFGISSGEISSFVQKYGIRQCEVCKKRYFEPIDICDTACNRCFQLGLAEFNLEFMEDIGAIDKNKAKKIRHEINIKINTK